MKLPEVTEIRRLEIRPGDRLILRLANGVIRPAEAKMIERMVRERLALPDDVHIVILSSEWEEPEVVAWCAPPDPR